MGMMILKSKYHIVAIIKIAMYRILFGKNFQVGGVLPSADSLISILKMELISK